MRTEVVLVNVANSADLAVVVSSQDFNSVAGSSSHAPSPPMLYGLRLAGTDEYRYIGQTAANLGRRMYGHRWESGRESPRLPVHKWIRSHKGQGITVDVLAEFDAGDVASLDASEIETIALLRTAGHRLLNVSDGGQGSRGVKRSVSSRLSQSQRMSGAGNPRFGTTWSTELREKIMSRMPDQSGDKNGNWGRTFSAEHRRLLSENHADVRGENGSFYGRHHTERTRETMRERHAERTSGQKAAITAKRMASLSARSPEDVAASSRKRTASARARDPGHQMRMTEAALAAASARSSEETNVIVARRRDTLSNRNPAEVAQTKARKQSTWASRTPEQIEASLIKRRATVAAREAKNKQTEWK